MRSRPYKRSAHAQPTRPEFRRGGIHYQSLFVARRVEAAVSERGKLQSTYSTTTRTQQPLNACLYHCIYKKNEHCPVQIEGSQILARASKWSFHVFLDILSYFAYFPRRAHCECITNTAQDIDPSEFCSKISEAQLVICRTDKNFQELDATMTKEVSTYHARSTIGRAVLVQKYRLHKSASRRATADPKMISARADKFEEVMTTIHVFLISELIRICQVRNLRVRRKLLVVY